MSSSKFSAVKIFSVQFERKIFILFFLGLLLLPIFQEASGLFNYPKLNEKRKKAEMPILSWGNLASGDYFQKVNSFYSDNYGFRDLLIQTHNTFNLRAFDKLVTDDLVLGKEGWLYYYITINDYQKKSLHPKEIEKIAVKLEKFSENLEAQGIKFYFTLSPNKSTLYPEYMSESISPPKAGDSSNLELLSKRLLEGEKIKYLDLVPMLQEKKMSHQLYPKNDSHWTYTGSYLVANEILAKLYQDNQFEFKSSTINFEEYQLFDSAFGGGGDLQELLGAFGATNFEEARKKLSDPIIPDNIEKLPKTLWYQTSFSDKLKPFITPYFEEIQYLHFQQAPMIRTLESNLSGVRIVVFEQVERWIPELLTYEFPESN